jgi:hypothetical protein
MKRCPKCQKTFEDSLRFCQTDGSPLLDDAGIADGGTMNKADVIPDIPNNYDPMKTMVSLPDNMKSDAQNQPPPSPFGDQISNTPPTGENKPYQPSPYAASAPPNFNEPSLNPPSFGDLSPGSPSSTSDNQSSRNEPPKFESPASFGSTPSPFDNPPTPPPAYKEPEPMFGGQQPPLNQSTFGQPQTPFGQAGEPSNQSMQQTEWTPPPTPVAGWQDQGLGADTPFQPPAVAAGGQNNTLAIVSLVSGILGLCCGLLGIVALVTGYMAKNNIEKDPAQYGGRGFAQAGMILGGISILLMIVGIILNVMGLLIR